MITVERVAYSTRVFDNIADHKSGELIAKQIEEEIDQLNAYGVIITDVCTNWA